MIADSKRHALKQSKLAQKDQLDEEFDISQDDLVGAVEANSSEDKDSSSASKSDSDSINGIALPSITVPSRSKVKSKREVKISMSDISCLMLVFLICQILLLKIMLRILKHRQLRLLTVKNHQAIQVQLMLISVIVYLLLSLIRPHRSMIRLKLHLVRWSLKKQQSENIQELIDLNLLDESANKAFKGNDQDSNNQESKDQVVVAKKQDFSSIPSDIPKHLLEEIDAMCDQTEPAFISDFFC